MELLYLVTTDALKPSQYTHSMEAKTKVFLKNKPWVSKHLKKVLNEKKRVYFLEDLADRKEVQRAVKSEIRKARENYKKN